MSVWNKHALSIRIVVPLLLAASVKGCVSLGEVNSLANAAKAIGLADRVLKAAIEEIARDWMESHELIYE